MTLALLLGAVVGAILAFTGAGGGMLAMPLLMFGLDLGVSEAAPVSLLAVSLAAGSGALIGLRHGHLRYRAAGFMALLGVVAAPLGSWLGQRIPNAPLTVVFAAVLVATSVRLLLRGPVAAFTAQAPQNPPCRRDPVDGRLRWTAACARALGAAGLGAGMVSSLLGVGGGFVIVPALLRVTDLDMQSIAVTSLAVIAGVSTASLLFDLALGTTLALSTALPFAAGAVLGLVAGRRASRHFSGPRLQQAFALLGLAAAAMLLLHLARAA